MNPSIDPNQPQQQPTFTTPPQPVPGQPFANPPQPTVSGAPYNNMPFTPVQPSGSNKKLPLIIGGVVALILIGIGVAVAMGGKDSSAKTPVKTQASSASDKTSSPDLATQDTKASPAKSVKTVNAIITDPTIGYKITATSVVINPFPFPEKYKNFGEGKVIVLVQYSVQASTKYSGSPTGGYVSIVDASGKTSTASTSNYTAEMNAAGYTPEPSSVSTGKTITGYEAYAVTVDQISTLSLLYKQPAAKVINGGQTIPAQTYTAKLF